MMNIQSPLERESWKTRAAVSVPEDDPQIMERIQRRAAELRPLFGF